MTISHKKDQEQRFAEAAAKVAAAHSFPPKLSGWDFYRSIGSPKYVVAPMVDQSELAWRILSRKYNAELCYTPMFHSRLFSTDARYREEQWGDIEKGLGGGGANDRPLVAQFCANDPEHLLNAALLVAPYCDAVDLNLGCPQHIARRGHYGSFLMEDWPLIATMISTLHKHLPVPVTAKIRVFPEAEKTVEYAKMVVEAGAQILVVHGRLREMKGHKTGLADWNKIKLVQEAVGHKVPVIANGNILYHEDIQHCLDATGCAGVMSAEGNLYNPAIFTPEHPETWRLAEEYLTICDELDTKVAYARGHLFKIFRPSLNLHPEYRGQLGSANSREEFWRITKELKNLLLDDKSKSEKSGETFEGRKDEQGFPVLPHWVAQPYFRPPLPEQVANKGATEEKATNSGEATATGDDATDRGSASSSSKNKRTVADAAHDEHDDDLSSLEKSGDQVTDKVKDHTHNIVNKKTKRAKVAENLCHGEKCGNTCSAKCAFHRCRGCCRGHQRATETFTCEAHPIKKKQQAPSLPRVPSDEAVGGVALEGMVNPTPTPSEAEQQEQPRKSRCLVQ
ncbi:tRNA-dihydrouridine(16/17) synthase [NAD(P)(+)]-like protein [Actinomortierella ambigua]|uniref:tRNA-dihydrouridine(16/17) synthase [NAD(P)(+)] n=1 Tax=Actinomortierella ambigua TaxID=1343610 RepID=A0A9P6QL94_9FUNG|nr:tRNA-dihydrouridine(16/17) synthase [NAD(P)(+)]-like protein [Actinomortierella ambigua]